MARLALIGGAYSARSIIANCQRAINYYPEINSKDAPVPVTHYQRPGLRPRVTADTAAAVRCLYRASNGVGYAVVGSNVYLIASDWSLTLLGTITLGRTNPCSMIDNGIDLLLVDGSANGWTINLTTQAFTQIVDGTGTFTGADKVAYLDTFILWNIPGTDEFGSTLSNQITPFEPLYIAAKSRYPDLLATIVVNHYELMLMGTLKSEIWYDVGSPQFPFASLPGATIEHGCVAKYSVATSDISAFWLGQDLQGQGIVFRLRSYECKVISNYAISNAIQGMIDSGAGIEDAIGYCYQLGGHVFYVLTFPAGDQTWVFDDSIGNPELAWHQEAWTDNDGLLHRHRGNCFAYLNGVPAVGDWENGTIYQLDSNTYTDTLSVGASPGPISFIRTFPHILLGKDIQGRPILADGRMMKFDSFIADIQSGRGPKTGAGGPPEITLRYSDDRGETFHASVLLSNGSPGEYQTQPKAAGLGQARDRIFELSHSIPGPVALNGAWVEAMVMNV